MAADAPAPAEEHGKQLTVIGAAFLGVGAMVGAGIFALLGQAGAVAGSAVWLSFLLAGAITALLGYVVVKLGVRYPSRGGFISYLVAAFGNGRLVGITSWLLYFVILIVTAMVAVSFGAYGSSLFFGDDAAAYWDNVLASLVVVAMAVLNLFGAAFVAEGAVADRLGPARRLRRLRPRDARPDRSGSARALDLSVRGARSSPRSR